MDRRRYVMPGTYTVALMSGGKVLDSKPLKIVFDPDVHFAVGEHERYNAIVTDLHAMQRRGVAMATALNSLYPQMEAAAKSIGEKSDIPANVKTQFESLNKEFDAIRKKFGVPIARRSGRSWRRWRRSRRRGGSGERARARVDAEDATRRRVGNAESGVGASVQRCEGRAAEGGGGWECGARKGECRQSGVGQIRGDDQGSGDGEVRSAEAGYEEVERVRRRSAGTWNE